VNAFEVYEDFERTADGEMAKALGVGPADELVLAVEARKRSTLSPRGFNDAEGDVKPLSGPANLLRWRAEALGAEAQDHVLAGKFEGGLGEAAGRRICCCPKTKAAPPLLAD